MAITMVYYNGGVEKLGLNYTVQKTSNDFLFQETFPDLYDCSPLHYVLLLPAKTRSLPCCNKNVHPWGQQMNITGTSFEVSWKERWVHSKRRQCCCYRGSENRKCYSLDLTEARQG